MREERERCGANNTLSPERVPIPFAVSPPTARQEEMRARHRDIVYGRNMTTCPAPTKRDIELMEQRN
eukprot:9007035-Heterocapsa_arctica.AAC.1